MKPQKVTTIAGFKYSRKEFEGYTHRAKVLITTVDTEHNLDIYTDNPSRNRTEDVLLSRRSENATSLQIIHWTTKEQDDLDAKFIESFLNS